MRDHSENTLRAAIKCLRDTVAPALDPADPQANEQLRLTVDFLEFLRTHLYDLHPRLRYELRCQLAVAHDIADAASSVSPDVGERLAGALARADATYADPDAHTYDLQTASEDLWGHVRGVLREARRAPEELRDRIAQSVLTGLEPLITLETSWYVPFGFVPDPASARDLGALLPTRSGART